MARDVADSTGKKASGLPAGNKGGEPVTGKKNSELSDEFLPIDPDGVEFDSEEEVVAPSRANQKDPSIRRKIEDLLERRRLREELGIYDDEAWEGL